MMPANEMLHMNAVENADHSTGCFRVDFFGESPECVQFRLLGSCLVLSSWY